ncbi:Glycine/D-amino acid oxidase [Friedmanniella luteola]|uniref:Glycine/D-amino acid oxidase n=1 Tax=Friedmanniella luteola TaxID=546871 RepID=A0A1H1TL23_9ACTN|nr:FAD-binding oxidoreductase [Friedmanniella luteola]SDS61035.1 Glycine/D-amino acid oxidase [Friedmanniella luteola]
MRVVVVGAGVVGAAVAHHLARAGAAVTLLETSTPASGVTGRSFGWIGEPGGADPVDASTVLRRTALVDYRRLEQELPGLVVRWCGSLGWGSAPLPRAADLAPGERLVDADAVRRLEPHLREPPGVALLRTTDGVVEPAAVTAALVAGARGHGAVVHLDRPVTALRQVGGRVVGVDTPTGPLPADRVVLAAGAATAALCAPLGVGLPLRASPALLLHLDAPPGLVRTVVDGPDLEVREAAPGHLLAAEEHRGQTTRDDLQRAGSAVLARLRARFRGAAEVRVADVQVGARPMPADGLPLVGPLPGHPEVHVVVMHSAVTLAPVVGRLVAAELVGGTPAPALQGLRPGRPAPAAGAAGRR